MPYVKISPATKKQALEKLAAGMPIADVAKMFAISSRTLGTWQQKQSGTTRKSSVPASPSQQSNASQNTGQNPQSEQQENPSIDFVDSPAPVEKKNVVDSAWSSLKGMLGISDEKKASAPIFSAKLDAKRQQFVDSVTPTLSLGLMALAAWWWGRIGPEYSVLAPDDKVAQKIVEPLLRVYARHASFLTDVNPDVADIGASCFAIIGYVNVSLKLYQQIKQDRENEENGQGNGGHGGWREYRPAPPENGTGNNGDRYTDVQRGGGGNGTSNGSNGGYPGNVNIPNLSNQEAAQYAALSRLSQLDYAHRARQSGRP